MKSVQLGTYIGAYQKKATRKSYLLKPQDWNKYGTAEQEKKIKHIISSISTKHQNKTSSTHYFPDIFKKTNYGS